MSRNRSIEIIRRMQSLLPLLPRQMCRWTPMTRWIPPRLGRLPEREDDGQWQVRIRCGFTHAASALDESGGAPLHSKTQARSERRKAATSWSAAILRPLKMPRRQITISTTVTFFPRPIPLPLLHRAKNAVFPGETCFSLVCDLGSGSPSLRPHLMSAIRWP